MRLDLFDHYNIATYKVKGFNENFKAVKDWDQVESKHSIRKINKIEKTLTLLIFDTLLNRYYVKQNPVTPSEFVLTKFYCSKAIFQEK